MGHMETIWKLIIAAGIAALVIFMQVLACVIGNDGQGNWMLLITLVPLVLFPVPLLLLRLFCGGGGDMFSEQPKGKHWAEFMSSFFFAGTWAIPIVLQLTNAITWPTLLLSLGGTLIGTIATFFGLYCANKESDSLNINVTMSCVFTVVGSTNYSSKLRVK